tara:strand:- start:1889 stop:2398 length:510 start_codon:yes stop_codon:yes gene_type:complete
MSDSTKSKPDNLWTQPTAPPPPMFVGEKERDLVKQINDEIIENVVGQQILYFPIDMEASNFHSLYGEAIKKTFLPPIRIYALVVWEGSNQTSEKYGIDRVANITVHMHQRRLTEDQDLFARIGDYVQYEKQHYEIVKLSQPRRLFGQDNKQVEVVATCRKAREGLFDAS